MSYEIHITRIGPDRSRAPISLSDWHAAVGSMRNVRFAEGRYEVRNPGTGEVISIGNAGGDAEVLFPSEGGRWRRVFRWSQPGRISFGVPRDFDQPSCEIRRVAADLARILGAQLVGDEGEIYA